MPETMFCFKPDCLIIIDSTTDTMLFLSSTRSFAAGKLINGMYRFLEKRSRYAANSNLRIAPELTPYVLKDMDFKYPSTFSKDIFFLDFLIYTSMGIINVGVTNSACEKSMTSLESGLLSIFLHILNARLRPEDNFSCCTFMCSSILIAPQYYSTKITIHIDSAIIFRQLRPSAMVLELLSSNRRRLPASAYGRTRISWTWRHSPHSVRPRPQRAGSRLRSCRTCP